MRHELPGLRPDGLMSYLCALGTLRALHNEDPSTTCWWEGNTFVVDAEVTDLPEFFVERYRPTPVVSPWNGGSGYGAKDKKQRAAIARLAQAGTPRLAAYAATHEVAEGVSAESTTHGWSKERMLQELRNRLPDEALPWLDACAVLTAEGPQFPPLTGTGGNDGRLDFSSNFHQRLDEVLPDLSGKPSSSREWVGDLLHGQPTSALVKANVGQYDPLGGGSPGSWAFGSADSLVNPWAYVLMVEGLVQFAASPAKRLGEGGTRASIPFTVAASADGPVSGAADEESRGEVWTPVWSDALALDDVDHLFANAKASWDGNTPRQSAQMYAALHSSGVDRRAARFVRYGLFQRNGLAYTATTLDDLDSRPEPGIDLAIPIERRARAFRASNTSPAGLVRAVRARERAFTEFARDVTPDALVSLLAAQAGCELAFGRSAAGRESVRRCPPASLPGPVLDFLRPLLKERPEFRIAASLASCTVQLPGEHHRSVRDLVLGTPPRNAGDEWSTPTVAGFGQRPLPDVLADAAVWTDHHASHSSGVGRGLRLASHRSYQCHWTDAHAWVTGEVLDERQVERAFLALLALDWRQFRSGTRHGGTTANDSTVAHRTAVPPSLELALLSAFAEGAAVTPTGDPAAEQDRRGLRPGWALRIRAGRTSEVVAEASSMLNRGGVARNRWHPPIDTPSAKPPRKRHVTTTAPPRSTLSGPRLLAGLWLPFSREALELVGHATDLQQPTRLASSF